MKHTRTTWATPVAVLRKLAIAAGLVCLAFGTLALFADNAQAWKVTVELGHGCGWHRTMGEEWGCGLQMHYDCDPNGVEGLYVGNSYCPPGAFLAHSGRLDFSRGNVVPLDLLAAGRSLYNSQWSVSDGNDPLVSFICQREPGDEESTDVVLDFRLRRSGDGDCPGGAMYNHVYFSAARGTTIPYHGLWYWGSPQEPAGPVTNQLLGSVKDGDHLRAGGYILIGGGCSAVLATDFTSRIQFVDRCPDHNPGKYNGVGFPNFQNTNNCYNYATDRQTNTRAVPGLGSGNELRQPPYSVEDVRAALISDGLISLDTTAPYTDGYDTQCPENACIRIAAFVVPDGECNTLYPRRQDVHFLREGADGKWSHKRGQWPVGFRDAAGNTISRPDTASFDYRPEHGCNYREFAGYFCVPDNATILKGLKENGRESRTEDSLSYVESGGWSCLQGVRAELSDDDVAYLRSVAAGLPEAPSQGWDSLGVTGGVVAWLADGNGSGIIAMDGYLGIYDEIGVLTYREDVANVGGWLRGKLDDLVAEVKDSPEVVSRIRVHPNPATTGAHVEFSLRTQGNVVIDVFDAGGRHVRAMFNGQMVAGERTLSWDLKDKSGKRVGAGTYFVRVRVDGRKALTGAMVVVR